MASSATPPPPLPAAATPTAGDEVTDLSKQYDTPMGLAHTTMQALKDRITLHYDLASDYYLNLWYAPLSLDSTPCLSTYSLVERKK